MRYKLRLSEQAVQEMAEVLDFTRKQFGELKCEQYKGLIRQALAAIARNSGNISAKHRPEIRPDAWTFHIAPRGRRARHLFLYRIIDNQYINVTGFVHDSMDLRQNLWDE